MTFPASELLKNWDDQQRAYISHREERYQAALDILETLYGQEFHVIDLACGPGSFSKRILARFPAVRVTAIDLDPLLLTLAKEALCEYKGRIHFFSADIAKADCFDGIVNKPQAIVSSTAIHWLLPDQQVALYRNIFAALDDHGIFLNADHQRFDHRSLHQKMLAALHDKNTQKKAWSEGAQNWDAWFKEATRYPELARLMDERSIIFEGRPMPISTTVDFQLAALRQAGFTEVGTIWQYLDDYITAAWK